MNIDIRQDCNGMTLMLAGRLDTATATQASAAIDQALTTTASGTDCRLTCDAEQLEYISSSGLRILLSLARRYKDFRIVEAQPAVYEVLETTGFTKMMAVERALRRLSVEGCQVIGVGGVGTVYRLDGDTIIKVFREGTTLDEVRREINMSKEAFVLGMPTAISFDVVRVGEQFGLVYELLEADTLSACIAREPERIDEFAKKYADLFRQMHDIEVPQGGGVPCAMEREMQQIRHIRRYFPQESIDLMLHIVDAIPEANRLLHLDLQTKNAMVQNGELMLIDMGEVGYGHPMLDLGHAYSAMVTLVGDYDQIIGKPRQQGMDLWQRAIDYYLEGLPTEVAAQRKAQIEVVSCVRNFSWLALSDSFPEAVINTCKNLFDERIGRRKDYILDVCKTFKEWTA
ncbi:MAG: STAS domain-containing protein [Bacteroidaceae bacterium]|nr:STAS domain-containing protein [Bacteroidaceae bacterium]